MQAEYTMKVQVIRSKKQPPRFYVNIPLPLAAALDLEAGEEVQWQPPILKTIATSGTGVPELVDAIWRFRSHSEGTRSARRQQRCEFRLRELVSQQFMERLERGMLKPGELAAMVERVAAREVDPYTAADELMSRAGLKAGPYK